MEDLYCGFSQIDITPEDPSSVYLDGYGYRVTPAVGVRDKISAKVFYSRCGKKEFAVITLDVCGLNVKLNRKIRSIVRAFTGLKDENFVLCASHSHAAPACGVLMDLPINYQYWNAVGEKAAKAVMNAKNGACKGELRCAAGNELTVPANRRNRPDTIDRRVKVCGFFDENGLLKGVLANASCHAVCVQSYYISADYPSVLFARAAEKYKDVPFMFLQGRGADIDPYISPDKDRREESVREDTLARLGGEFADSVFLALDKMKNGGGKAGKIKFAEKKLSVPTIYPDKKRLQQDYESEKQEFLRLCAAYDGYNDDGLKRYHLVEVQWHDRVLELSKIGKGSFVDAHIQYFEIGGAAAFAFVPFELLTDTGNAIEKILDKTGLPAENRFVAGYCNGVNGYLPPSAESQTEGYETKSSSHWYSIDGEYDKRAERMVLSAIDEMSGVRSK